MRLHIIQTNKRISVWQQSQLGIVYRALAIGSDTLEMSSLGDRRVWVTVSEKEITVDTKFKNGRLIDTRRIIIDPRTRQETLSACLQLTVRGQAKATKTTRFFRRKSAFPDPVIRSSPKDAIATVAGLAYERIGKDFLKLENDGERFVDSTGAKVNY